MKEPIFLARAWIELCNNDNKDVSIGKWSVSTSEGRSMSVPEDTIIRGLDYYIIPIEPLWFKYTSEILVLNNETGVEIDRTPLLNDSQDTELSWIRDPDGRNTNIMKIGSFWHQAAASRTSSKWKMRPLTAKT